MQHNHRPENSEGVNAATPINREPRAARATPAPPHVVGPPPASAKAKSRLPLVRVRAVDMSDETTACCAVCLDEHSVNSNATRMPCGHLYHPSCIENWLSRHCTCPVCRFEIHTDDVNFERERVVRNRRHRRLVTIRRTELDQLHVRAIRDLLAAADVYDKNCLERSDLISLAVSTDRVTVVEDRIFATRARIDALPVSALLELARRANIPTQNRGLEREDLVQALLRSGDLVLVDSDPEPDQQPHQVVPGKRTTRNAQDAPCGFRSGFLLRRDP